MLALPNDLCCRGSLHARNRTQPVQCRFNRLRPMCHCRIRPRLTGVPAVDLKRLAQRARELAQSHHSVARQGRDGCCPARGYENVLQQAYQRLTAESGEPSDGEAGREFLLPARSSLSPLPAGVWFPETSAGSKRSFDRPGGISARAHRRELPNLCDIPANTCRESTIWRGS